MEAEKNLFKEMNTSAQKIKDREPNNSKLLKEK